MAHSDDAMTQLRRPSQPADPACWSGPL